MTIELLNDKMHNGSRNFILLPAGRVPAFRLFFRIFTLFGAYPTAFIPSFAESWIDFKYKGHKFSINDQFGDYWFFVNDPSCPDSLLLIVTEHFASVLLPSP